MPNNFGKIQLFTGNGKGKTTAALGTALRAHGRGKKVVFVYFDKGGDNYSEDAVLDQLGIEYYRFGRDRIDPVTGKFKFGVTDEDRAEGKKGLEKVREVMDRGGVDVLVLDEVNISTKLTILSESDVLELIDDKPANMELIMTGRDAPQSFIDKADLVTEMTLVKHYFYNDELAREGLDY